MFHRFLSVRTLAGLGVAGSLLAACAIDDSNTTGVAENHGHQDNINWKFPGRHPTVKHENLLYVAAIEYTEPGATPSPDAIYVVDVKPGSATYGQIINRVDMPNVGDELHHFGYNWTIATSRSTVCSPVASTSSTSSTTRSTRRSSPRTTT